MLAIVLVYQQFENYVLQPTILGKAADVSGFFVIVSVMIFGALLGVIGAIIAVPIIASIQIVVRELTEERRAAMAALRDRGRRRHGRDGCRDVVGSLSCAHSRPGDARGGRAVMTAATATTTAASRGRIIAARALLVVGVLLTVVSILSTYVKREALDSGQFRQTSREADREPADPGGGRGRRWSTRSANVDVSGELEEKLPTNLQGLASPIAGLSRGLADRRRTSCSPGRASRTRSSSSPLLAQKQFVEGAARRHEGGWTRRTATSSSTSGRSS